jgi:hypothetical protein
MPPVMRAQMHQQMYPNAYQQYIQEQGKQCIQEQGIAVKKNYFHFQLCMNTENTFCIRI